MPSRREKVMKTTTTKKRMSVMLRLTLTKISNLQLAASAPLESQTWPLEDQQLGVAHQRDDPEVETEEVSQPLAEAVPVEIQEAVPEAVPVEILEAVLEEVPEVEAEVMVVVIVVVEAEVEVAVEVAVVVVVEAEEHG